MGYKALIVVVIAWAFSFLLWNNLPTYIALQTELNQILFIIWNVLYAVLFIRWGLME